MELLFACKLPDDVAAQYLSDKVTITKALGRNTATGQIEGHYDMTPYYPTESPESILADKQIAAVAGGFVLGALIVGGVTYIVNKKFEKTQQQAQVQIPKCMDDFRIIFKQYLREAKNKDLNIATVCELISILNEIERTTDADITIDFSAEELKTLLNIIVDYTKNFKANESSASIPETVSDNSDNNLKVLKHCLLIQKEYFENIA